MSESVEALAKKVRDPLAAAAFYANEDGRQLLYSDLKVADDSFALILARLATAEKEGAVAYRDGWNDAMTQGRGP